MGDNTKDPVIGPGYNWNDIIITYKGKEIKTKNVEYNIYPKVTHPQMKYYHRKGNRYYFKNKAGDVLIVTSNDDIYNYVKYGKIVDLDFSE